MQKRNVVIINVYSPPDCPTEKFINPLSELRTIIIYHNFLPPPRRGSHGKSDNTRTIINIRPLKQRTQLIEIGNPMPNIIFTEEHNFPIIDWF